MNGGNTTTGYVAHTVRFALRKRATPTVTVYDQAGSLGAVSRDNVGVSSTNGNSPTVATTSDTSVLVASASGAAATGVVFHFVADAEL